MGAEDAINTKLDFCSRGLSFSSRRYYLSSRWIRFLLIHHSVNCSISHGEAEVKKRGGTGIFNYCNYSGGALEMLLRSRIRRSGRSSPGTTDPGSTEQARLKKATFKHFCSSELSSFPVSFMNKIIVMKISFTKIILINFPECCL